MVLGVIDRLCYLHVGGHDGGREAGDERAVGGDVLRRATHTKVDARARCNTHDVMQCVTDSTWCLKHP